MRNRGLPILFVVFIFLAVILFLQDRGTIGGGNNPVVSTPVFIRVFPEMAVLDILAIRLEAPTMGQSLTIAREPSGIWAGVDFSDPVDQNLATTIARSVVLMPYIRTIDINQDTDIAEYGLTSPPPFLISVLTADGEQHSIVIGDPLQTGPEFYALVNDREEIYVVQRGPVDYLVSFLTDPPIAIEGASITP